MQGLNAVVIFKHETSPIYKHVTFSTIHNSTTKKEEHILSLIHG